MIILPEINKHTDYRMNNGKVIFQHKVPNNENYWKNIYDILINSSEFDFPIIQNCFSINEHFGYYGERWHPINQTPNYFHVGIDFSAKVGERLSPICDGNFEYSGYENVIGKYVMLSHPNIRTQDGYVLYSLYMHMDEVFIKFNLIEKCLRLVGFRLHKNIKKESDIGTVGNSGNELGTVPHLHLQLEFRKKNSKIIVIDPYRVLIENVSKSNLTKGILNKAQFEQYYLKHKKSLKPWLKFM